MFLFVLYLVLFYIQQEEGGSDGEEYEELDDRWWGQGNPLPQKDL